MRNVFLVCAAMLAVSVSSAAFSQYRYNPVPAGDAQYAQCLSQSVNNYTGGLDPSPVAGQSKVQAFCTCVYNETPEDFKGNLASYAETAKGAAMNKTCEKYSSWGN